MSNLSKLILAKRTMSNAKHFLDDPSQSLMVVGRRGNGADKLVRALAADLLGINVDELDRSARVLHVVPNENSNISIDEVRNAWIFAKTPSSYGDGKKVVIFHRAQSMTHEAQNSVLKLLEEPPEYLYALLELPTKNSVLSTIDSRSSKLMLYGLDKNEFTKALIQNGISSETANELWLTSAGEIYSALGQSGTNGQENNLGYIKELLGEKPIQRLAQMKTELKDRDAANKLTLDLINLSYIGLRQAVLHDKNVKTWLKNIKLSEQILINLQNNGNVKLNVTYLLTNI